MSTTTFDPASTATQLATAFTSGRQTMLDTQTKAAQAASTGLAKLQSALSAFDSAMYAISSKKSVLVQSATLSNPAIGSATATAAAAAGSYSFFVEKLASAHQAAYSVAAAPADAMKVTLGAGAASFDVDLTAADKDGGGLSAKEIAAAINAAPNNASLVTASFVTVGGTPQLVLTSNASGLAGAITLTLNNSAVTGTNLVDPADATVWLGAQGTGVQLTQSSNTFSVVDGVSTTFSKAMASGDAPVTLTVGRDDNATGANVQSFVDAYNKLKDVLDGMTATGDTKNNVAAGAFAHDSGVSALASRLAGIARESVGGVSLVSYGISTGRDGKLTLDQAKLKTKLGANPDGLAQIFGSNAAGARSGVLGDLDTYVDTWIGTVSGQITQRRNAVTRLQAAFTDRQASLDRQYNSAYQRYLVQFTKLQNLQSQMSQTSSMFTAMFSNNTNS
jgi:flagellar hook-associated protein 2